MKDRIEAIVRSAGADFTWGKPRQVLSDIIEKTSSINNIIDYPLSILELPFTETLDIKKVRLRGVKLILCALTRPEISNDTRYQDKYQPILNPLLRRLEGAIRSNSLGFEMNYSRMNPYASLNIEDDRINLIAEHYDVIETDWDIILNEENCIK